MQHKLDVSLLWTQLPQLWTSLFLNAIIFVMEMTCMMNRGITRKPQVLLFSWLNFKHKYFLGYCSFVTCHVNMSFSGLSK